MKYNFLLITALLFTFSTLTFGQLDSVYYQGPSQGSVASGVMVNIDNFLKSPVETSIPREIISPELLVTEDLSALNLDQSNLPPSIYSEDKSVSKERNVSSGQTILLNNWETDRLNNYIPPDPDVAVGPNHIITTVNVDFSIWDKEGNLLNNINGDTWCSQAIGAPDAFDPQVIYDHYDGRWFILWDTKSSSTQSSFVIAYSDDSDPTGIWYMYAINASMNGSISANYWADFPHVGFDSEAIYITSNQFPIAGGNQYPRIRIISKSELYSSNGGALTWNDIWNIRRPGGGSSGQPQMSTMPAISYTPSDIGYFAWAAFFNANYISIFKLFNPTTNPWLKGKAIAVPFYYDPLNANQLGGGTLIENDGAFKNRVVVRNGLLYGSRGIGNSVNTTYSSVKYEIVNLSSMTIFEQAEFGAVGYFYLYPQMTVDKDSNIAVTFSRSADNEYIGGYYATKYNGDSPGFTQSYPLAPGRGNYVIDFGSGRNRWGDYLGIYLDPVNEQDVWIFPEYAAATNVWGTYIGQIRMSPYPGVHAYAESFTVDFGNLEVGTASTTKTVTLSNYGEDDLVINTVNSPSGPFTLLTSLSVPFTLAPYDSVELEFEFNPTDAVIYEDLMSFTNNDPNFLGFTMKGRGFEINGPLTNRFYAISNATSPDTGKTLWLDKTTGVGTELGGSNFADIRALTVNPISNIMYGIVPGASSSELVRVNATEGDAYNLFTLPGLFMVGVAFDTTGILYGAMQNGEIHTIDLTTGTTTLVTTTVQLTAIAFDPLTNDLWATPRVVVGQKDRIFKIDLATGDTTNVGRTGFNVQTNDLAFDETGALYGVIGGATEVGKLISIDRTTAVGTEIGETGFTNIQALAYSLRGAPVSVDDEDNIPTEFALKQNYPNPFNPATKIEFSLPVSADVELVIYNILGQQVTSLINEQKLAGNHSIIWNANDSKGIKLSSGIYFYMLKASGVDGKEFQEIRKMVLIK